MRAHEPGERACPAIVIPLSSSPNDVRARPDSRCGTRVPDPLRVHSHTADRASHLLQKQPAMLSAATGLGPSPRVTVAPARPGGPEPGMTTEDRPCGLGAGRGRSSASIRWNVFPCFRAPFALLDASRGRHDGGRVRRTHDRRRDLVGVGTTGLHQACMCSRGVAPSSLSPRTRGGRGCMKSPGRDARGSPRAPRCMARTNPLCPGFLYGVAPAAAAPCRAHAPGAGMYETRANDGLQRPRVRSRGTPFPSLEYGWRSAAAWRVVLWGRSRADVRARRGCLCSPPCARESQLGRLPGGTGWRAPRHGCVSAQ
jgi:hypothetical protein